MAVTTTPAQKNTDLRIQRALSKPGAYGMKGFLLWTEAAWPKAISQAILKAAGKYTPGAGMPVTLASPPHGGFGGMSHSIPAHLARAQFPMGYLGDDSGLVDISMSVPEISQQTINAINAANDPSVPPVSGVTAATASQPASNSWMSDILGAVQTATQAALGVTQVKDAQAIFNINLQRAQQGLPPIATNPTIYGLPAPTANIGLTSGTQTALLIGVGILGVALLGGGLAVGSRGKRR